MSTKIYDGFTADGDLNVMLKRLVDLRPSVVEAGTHRLRSVAVQKLVFHHDQKNYGYSPEEVSWRMVVDEHRKASSGILRDMCDLRCDVSIGLSPSGRVLGILHTEQSSFVRILQNQHWYSEYGYWNNGDPPDGISDQDWEQRAKEWSSIHIPSHAMYSFKLCDFYDIDIQCPDNDVAWTYAPSLRERKENLFNVIMGKYYMQNRSNKNDDTVEYLEFAAKLRDGKFDSKREELNEAMDATLRQLYHIVV